MLALSCFVIPKFDGGIFTWSGDLRIYRVEFTLCNSCSMSLEFLVFWLSWNSITRCLNDTKFIFLICSCYIQFWLENSSIFSEFGFHVFDIYRILLVGFLQLFNLLFKFFIDLHKFGDRRPFSFEYVCKQRGWRAGRFEIPLIIYLGFFFKSGSCLFKIGFH